MSMLFAYMAGGQGGGWLQVLIFFGSEFFLLALCVCVCGGGGVAEGQVQCLSFLEKKNK